MISRNALEKLDREWMEEKQRHDSVPRLEILGFVGAISTMAGFALVMFGLWLDQLGLEDVRLERQLYPWPAVCMVLGSCIVVGSLVFVIRRGRRHSAYNQAKCIYDCRREKLLEDIYAGEQDSKKTDADTSS